MDINYGTRFTGTVETSYKHLPKDKQDRKAVMDCLQYLGNYTRFKALVKMFKNADTNERLHQLNSVCAFRIGIAGLPFFALIRRYSGQERFEAYWNSGLLEE
jgi:hypothetical protein